MIWIHILFRAVDTVFGVNHVINNFYIYAYQEYLEKERSVTYWSL